MHVLKACLFFQPFKLFHHAIQTKMIYYLIHSHKDPLVMIKVYIEQCMHVVTS